MWCCRLRIWHCHCSGLGHCCGMGLIPGWGTSACLRWVKNPPAAAVMRVPSLAQHSWLKYPVLLQLRLGCSPWPGNFHILWVRPWKRKRRRKSLWPRVTQRFFFFFLSAPLACGSSHARDRTHATAATQAQQWRPSVLHWWMDEQIVVCPYNGCYLPARRENVLLIQVTVWMELKRQNFRERKHISDCGGEGLTTKDCEGVLGG